jgi:hypothetical protein
MLQRTAGNEAQMTFKGYWVPVVTPGEGYNGRLCPHDHILVYPGRQEDIDKINEPRTTSSSDVAPVPKLGQQVAREPHVEWTE